MAEENTAPNPEQSNVQGDDTPTEPEQKVQMVEKDKYISLSKKFTDAQKELEAYKQKEAESQGKYKELAEEWQSKYTSLEAKWKQSAIQKSLAVEAQKLNPANIDAVLRLVDTSSLEIDDEGNVSGVEEALKTVQESVPQLFTVNPPKNAGRDSGSPDGGAGARIYKESELMNSDFVAKNLKDIEEAKKEGRIRYGQ